MYLPNGWFLIALDRNAARVLADTLKTGETLSFFIYRIPTFLIVKIITYENT